eukprot:GEMP01045425.1.p1 GENE.GEMP01045425.1~~GEMP01045425.1.p1  ORF type:complete len:335 (+),score=57.26 GEMP01045425.1:35-1006(+)
MDRSFSATAKIASFFFHHPSCRGAPARGSHQVRTMTDTANATSKTDVTQAISSAKHRTQQSLEDPQYSDGVKLALASRILHAQGHTNSLAGQASFLQSLDPFRMMTLKYGLGFDECNSNDMIVVDENIETVAKAPTRSFPNYAIRFHVHIYRARPDARCIIHTHPPHVNALALTGEQPMQAEHMDVMGLYEHVAYEQHWPGVPFGDEEGEFMVKVLGKDKYAAVLAHHGMLAVGRTIEEATYRGYFLEESAKLQLRTMNAMKEGHKMPKVDVALARQARDWRISEGPVNAHFRYWARQVLRSTSDELDNAKSEPPERAVRRCI